MPLLEIKAPYKNSPFKPALLFFFGWSLQNIFFVFLYKYFSFLLGNGINIGLAVLYTVGNIFAFVIVLSYLFKKKFSYFFISLAGFVVVVLICSYADVQIAPMKMNAVLGGISNSLSSGPQIQYYGDSPRRICKSEKTPSGMYQCQDCTCPQSNKARYDLATYDGVPTCDQLDNQARKTGQSPPNCTELKEYSDFKDPYRK